jgi:hypothetical protein
MVDISRAVIAAPHLLGERNSFSDSIMLRKRENMEPRSDGGARFLERFLARFLDQQRILVGRFVQLLDRLAAAAIARESDTLANVQNFNGSNPHRIATLWTVQHVPLLPLPLQTGTWARM